MIFFFWKGVQIRSSEGNLDLGHDRIMSLFFYIKINFDMG